ncbi:MAG: hypothetical protein ABW199_09310 [Caulobacterales bacterium]
MRNDPSKIPEIVGNMLAQFTFVNTFRLVKKDVEMDGVTLRAGESVVISLWGASNDALR